MPNDEPIDEWTLDPESKTRILDPWLASEPDVKLRRQVLEWVADLVKDPLRYQEHEPGSYRGRVVGTHIGVLFTLDLEGRRVMLADISSVA